MSLEEVENESIYLAANGASLRCRQPDIGKCNDGNLGQLGRHVAGGCLSRINAALVEPMSVVEGSLFTSGPSFS